MKRIWIAISALITITGLCIAEITWISNITDNLKYQIDSINELVSEENIDEAISLSEEINDNWVKNHNNLAMFIDHNNLEEIDQTMEIIDTCLKTNNISQFYIETAKIDSLIEDILDTEMPNFYNIL